MPFKWYGIQRVAPPLRCPVKAIAYPPSGWPYLTQLLIGTYYSVLELTVETLTLGSFDAEPEVYLTCFTLADWGHFVFTNGPHTTSHLLQFEIPD